MKPTQIECPFCGAAVLVDEESDRAVCAYCDKQIMFGDRKTIVYKNLAKLRELELQEEERLRNEKKAEEIRQAAIEAAAKAEKQRKRWWKWAVILPILSGLFLAISTMVHSSLMPIPALLFGYGSPIYLAVKYPKQSASKLTRFLLFVLFFIFGIITTAVFMVIFLLLKVQ